MMFREVLLLPAKTVADSGTETVDLNVTDPITELVVRYQQTNNATPTQDLPPETSISKIELVDGGRVLSSLTGKEAVAAACYAKGEWPYHYYSSTNGHGQWLHIPLPFGRFLGDPEFSLDAKRLLNPQLKVTWAKNDSHLTGSVSLEVRATVMQDAPASPSAILWKGIRQFVAAASGVEATDLPTDDVYRKLMIIPYITIEKPDTILTHFKLDCDMGKFVPFDLDSNRFFQACNRPYPTFHYNKTVYGGHGDTLENWMADNVTLSIVANGQNVIVNGGAGGNPTTILCIFNTSNVTVAAATMEIITFGKFPHNAMCYNFGLPDVPATWFPAPSFRSVRLLLTQGSASATVGILVQSPVTL